MTSEALIRSEWDPRRATTIAVAAFSTVVPLFLFGAFVGEIRAEIGLSDIEVGVVSGAFFASSGLFGIPSGAVVMRIGADRSMLVALLVSLASLVGLTFLVASAWHLVLFMLVAGGANALSQTATSSAMLGAVPARYYGMAFALKQINGPVASIFASLVLAFVITVMRSGWRSGFVIAIAAAVTLLALGLRMRPRDPAPGARDHRSRTTSPWRLTPQVTLLLTAATLAASIAAVLAAFFVLFLLEGGLTTTRAAGLLSVGGLAGIAGRLMWGFVSDRSTIPVTRLLALVFTLGAGGLFMLPRSLDSGLIALVAVLAFATAGSWQGMLLLRGATIDRDRSASTIGMLMTGIGLGGSLGPPAFGALVSSTSYQVAWSSGSGVLFLAALAMAALTRLEAERSVSGHGAVG